MFDPTAFDNLKVVVEGEVYDFDLSGEIIIRDRKDLFDFAHYERTYVIQYSLPDMTSFITLELRADMGHFLAERNGIRSKNKAGADIRLIYSGNEEMHEHKAELESAWGTDKEWEWIDVHSSARPLKVQGILSFNRVITEEMVDDVLHMVSFSVETLDILK
ncbi:hypothetical protein ACQ0QQ_10425 [Lysinibacillus sphaericus]